VAGLGIAMPEADLCQFFEKKVRGPSLRRPTGPSSVDVTGGATQNVRRQREQPRCSVDQASIMAFGTPDVIRDRKSSSTDGLLLPQLARRGPEIGAACWEEWLLARHFQTTPNEASFVVQEPCFSLL